MRNGHAQLRYTAPSYIYIARIGLRAPVSSSIPTSIPASLDLRVNEIGSPTRTRPFEEDNRMSGAMNTDERLDFNTPAAPSPPHRPLPSVPRNDSTASKSLSSSNLLNTKSTSLDSEILPKYPSLPPAYSALPGLPDEKKLQHADNLSNPTIYFASSASVSFTTSTPASSTFSASSIAPSSPPVARSRPTSPARLPVTPPRSAPASPSLVPPTLTALAIPPSQSPRASPGENLSALWSAEVQLSAVEPHRQSFTQALTRVNPPSTQTSSSITASERPVKSATTLKARESDMTRMRTGSGPALQELGQNIHVKTARRSASAHHLKQRSDAEMYNFPRAGGSFLTLISPDSAVSVELPRTPSLKEDMERITCKRERWRPRAPGVVDVAHWVSQTEAQSTRLVGEPATPHPARSPPAAPPVPQDPLSRERSASLSARGRSAHGPSAFRPPQTPLPAAPSAHRTQADRPHTSHQRAHTLADVPRQRFRSEPDLLALTKPKHTRSTSERLVPTTERPPSPSSPPLRRDPLVSHTRSTTPKLLRLLTSRAKLAFSGRSRVNSNADVPPTPPLPAHAIPIS